MEVLRAFALGGEIETAPIGCPVETLRRTIPIARHEPRIRAVAVHHVDLRVDPRVLRPVVSRVGDALAVGRDHGRAIGTLARGQLTHGAGLSWAAGHVDRVDVALAPLVVVGALAGEHDRLSVRHPRSANMVVVARRELTRRAARGRHDEDVPIAVIGEALSVAAVVEPLDDLRLLRPLGPLGLLRHLHVPLRLLLHEHREREERSVGRPLQIRGRLLHARHLRGGAFGIHPAHVDLRAGLSWSGRLPIREIGEAVAVRRPARVRSFREVPVARAVGAHDPEARLALVVHPVDPSARVDDLLPVGRDPRVGDRLQLEIQVEREPV